MSQPSSSLKRKDSDHPNESPVATKKSKSASEANAVASSSAAATEDAPKPFTNMTIPIEIKLPEATPNTVKICSWNVAGLRAAQKKGFKIYIEAEKPDILILTETKINDIPIDPYMDGQYKYRYWNIAVKKGYAGTAVFSKHKPLNVTYVLDGIDTPELVKGRLVILEFQTFYLVATYVPNAGTQLKTLDNKVKWQDAFESHVRQLDDKKPVLWGGDLNVAPTAKDLTHSKNNWNKTAGHTEKECNWYKAFLNPDAVDYKKFIDVWRKMHPDEQSYTYFSFLRKCREKNVGWRLDMFVASERLYSRIKTCEIRSEIYGASDHLPLVLEIAEDL